MFVKYRMYIENSFNIITYAKTQINTINVILLLSDKHRYCAIIVIFFTAERSLTNI